MSFADLTKIDVGLARTLLERRAKRVNAVDVNGCWIHDRPDKTGYGMIQLNGKAYRIHRVSYVVYKGQLTNPTNEIDHLCRNRSCFNPDHLEEVTKKENIKRMHQFKLDTDWYKTHGQASKTHCPRGHEYSPENTLFKDGSRRCKKCKTIRSAEAERRKNNHCPKGHEFIYANHMIMPSGERLCLECALFKDRCMHGHDLTLVENVLWKYSGASNMPFKSCRVCSREEKPRKSQSFIQEDADNPNNLCAPSRKLSDDDVRTIRTSTLSNKQLAELFNVSTHVVYCIKTRKKRADVLD